MLEAPGVRVGLQAEPIDRVAGRSWAACPTAGAVISFEGTTRDGPPGERVLQLEYEAYAAMAEPVLLKLAAEAQARWSLERALVLHRTGPVAVGEVSVLVVVAAAHRREAYAASAWLMDRLKAEAPIWKRELTEQGAAWRANAPASPEDER